MLERYRLALCNTVDAPTSPTAPAPSAPVVRVPDPAAPVPVTPAPGEEFKNMSADQFNARLAKERELGTKSFLKTLGFENVEAAQGFLAEARKLADANKTEQQKMAERLTALEPKAKEAEQLRSIVADRAKIEFERLPKVAQDYIAKMAGDDPVARLNAINAAAETGIITALTATAPAAPAPTVPVAAPPPAPPKPATTIAPPGPAAPQPAGTLTPKQQYLALKKTAPNAAAIFYRSNRAAIDADNS